MLIQIIAKGPIGEKIGSDLAMSIAAAYSLAQGIAELVPGWTPEQLSLTVDPSSDGAAKWKGNARVHYTAILPHLEGSTEFDMARVPEAIRKSLEDLGADNVAGLLYKDIAEATLNNVQITEPELRKRHKLAAGTCQGRIQTMKDVYIKAVPITA